MHLDLDVRGGGRLPRTTQTCRDPEVICTGAGTSLYGLISVMRHASSWSRKKHELADKPYLAAAA